MIVFREAGQQFDSKIKINDIVSIKFSKPKKANSKSWTANTWCYTDLYQRAHSVELGVRSLLSDDLFKTVQFDIRVRPYFIVKYSIQIQFYSRNVLTLIFRMSIQLQFHKLSANAVTPIQGSKYAAGLDLSAAEAKIIPSKGRALVKTDLQVAIPEGCYGRIAPRSGLAYKKVQ